MVGAQIQDGIIELSRHLHRPPLRSRGKHCSDRRRRVGVRRRDGQFDALRWTVEPDVDKAIVEAVRLRDPIERRQRTPAAAFGRSLKPASASARR